MRPGAGDHVSYLPSRRVWSWGEGSEESVAGALEFTKLSASFCCAENKGFIGANPEKVMARR